MNHTHACHASVYRAPGHGRRLTCIDFTDVGTEDGGSGRLWGLLETTQRAGPVAGPRGCGPRAPLEAAISLGVGHEVPGAHVAAAQRASPDPAASSLHQPGTGFPSHPSFGAGIQQLSAGPSCPSSAPYLATVELWGTHEGRRPSRVRVRPGPEPQPSRGDRPRHTLFHARYRGSSLRPRTTQRCRDPCHSPIMDPETESQRRRRSARASRLSPRARGADGAGRPALASPCAACEGATGAGRILSSCPPSSHDAGRREPGVC